jgi:hypothetical protein
VVHVHLGSSLPPYFWQTVRQTRRFHTGRIFCVVPAHAVAAPEAAELSVDSVSNTRWDDASAIRRLREVSWLTRVYGADGFWHHSVERLFILAELMREQGLGGALHLENDVTIYFDPERWSSVFEKCFGRNCALPPQGPAEGCNAAIFYAGSVPALDAVCDRVLELLPLGEWKLRGVLKSAMVHDAMLLGIVQRENPDLVQSLPIAPAPPRIPARIPRTWPRPAAPLLRWLDSIAPRIASDPPPHGVTSRLEEFGALFDGGPWGQYAGGTPHGRGPGAAFPHHWIGPDLLSGRYALVWRLDEHCRRFPAVIDRHGGDREWKLNNLHVHCKRIGEFV